MKSAQVVIVLVLLVFIGHLSAQEDRPNVLLIISDQHTGKVMTQRGYSYLNTPGIDSLAQEGVTFTRAYSAYPVCAASRAAMMTGVMPHKSSENLTDYKSLGKAMKEKGYETAYFGKWHVAKTDMDKTASWHAFDQYEDIRDDTRVQNLSEEFIEKSRQGPFFMVSSFMNPHDACELARNMSGIDNRYRNGAVEENAPLEITPPLPDNFAVPEDEAEGIYVRRAPDSTDMRMYRKHPTKYWDKARWRQYMYGYDRLVEKMDQHIFHIVDKLKDEGLLENTVIIYTSDHGDGHAAHQWNQKMTFYEEAINVPFIISWKGHVRSGSIDKKTLVNTGLDIYPTISSLAGASQPDYLLGINLMPSAQKRRDMKKPIPTRKYSVSEITQFNPGDSRKLVGRMAVTDRYKYFVFNRGENREQFFDLQKDSGELHPITDNPKYSNQLKVHREMLKEWINKSSDSFKLEYVPD